MRILLFFLLLIAAGCTFQSSTSDESKAFQGKEGLTMSFANSAPPDTVVAASETQIPVALIIQNLGAADLDIDCTEICDRNAVPAGTAYFSLSAGDEFAIAGAAGTLQELQRADILEGPDSSGILAGKETIFSGGRALIDLSDKVVVNLVDSSTTATMGAALCYPYRTKFSASVCVDASYYLVPLDSQTCRLRDSSYSNQGAPVAITKIMQDPALKTNAMVYPRFKIFVSNVGDGAVVAREELQRSCSAGGGSSNADPFSSRGPVTVTAATIAGKSLNCVGKTVPVSFGSRNNYIQCDLPLVDGDGNDVDGFESGDSNFISTLRVELAYGYVTTARTSVNIEVLNARPQIDSITFNREAEPGSTIVVTVRASDDEGVAIIFFENEGNKVEQCGGRVCTATFEATVPTEIGEPYEFKAWAKDNTNQESIPITSVQGTTGYNAGKMTQDLVAFLKGLNREKAGVTTITYSANSAVLVDYDGKTAVAVRISNGNLGFLVHNSDCSIIDNQDDFFVTDNDCNGILDKVRKDGKDIKIPSKDRNALNKKYFNILKALRKETAKPTPDSSTTQNPVGSPTTETGETGVPEIPEELSQPVAPAEPSGATEPPAQEGSASDGAALESLVAVLDSMSGEKAFANGLEVQYENGVAVEFTIENGYIGISKIGTECRVFDSQKPLIIEDKGCDGVIDVLTTEMGKHDISDDEREEMQAKYREIVSSISSKVEEALAQQ